MSDTRTPTGQDLMTLKKSLNRAHTHVQDLRRRRTATARALRDQGWTLPQLAAAMGVSPSAVHQMLGRKADR